MKNYNTFGVMIDMSRNAVMSLDGLKRFFPLLKKMGYNCMFLYTEDTYEVDGEPYFGYMRGRYSKAELKAIDDLGASMGIEVIPCIQTLAHLTAATRWGKFPTDMGDVLLTDDERSYEFINHMFASLSECFRTRRIHIGMDEAFNLGRGKHLDIHGYEPVNTIIKRHLARVCEIAKQYDYEVMIWSDMFFRSWNNGKYVIPKCEIPKEVVEALPRDVIPVFWEYWHTKKEDYADMFENHKQLSKNTWFAGGAWSWIGMIPSNRYTLKTMLPALDACREKKVKNVFFTMWGDNGGECSHFSQLPSLFYLAEYAKGNTDEELIKAKFKKMFGIDYDEFMEIDMPNHIVEYTSYPKNPAKYMLLSDYFNDFLDYSVTLGAGEKFGEISKKLSATAKKTRRYGYVFDAAAKLCDVLEIKYELGLRTRRAYEAGDKDALRQMAEKDYPEVVKRLNIFVKAFEKQWMTDNKPHGFEVQDRRIGGVIRRTEACRARILAYVNGKIDRIEELDEALLPFGGGEPGYSLSFNYAQNAAAVNLS